jgi:hypothetical protein
LLQGFYEVGAIITLARWPSNSKQALKLCLGQKKMVMKQLMFSKSARKEAKKYFRQIYEGKAPI